MTRIRFNPWDRKILLKDGTEKTLNALLVNETSAIKALEVFPTSLHTTANHLLSYFCDYMKEVVNA